MMAAGATWRNAADDDDHVWSFYGLRGLLPTKRSEEPQPLSQTSSFKVVFLCRMVPSGIYDAVRGAMSSIRLSAYDSRHLSLVIYAKLYVVRLISMRTRLMINYRKRAAYVDASIIEVLKFRCIGSDEAMSPYFYVLVVRMRDGGYEQSRTT